MMNIFILLLVVCYRIHDVDGGILLRGTTVWRVILCKFSDSPPPKLTVAAIKDKILNRGTKGVADYWADMSGGLINFGSSSVVGWFTLSQTMAQHKAKANNGRINDCITASGVPQSASEYIVVVTSPDVGIWGSYRQVYVAETSDLDKTIHEMAHGYGLGHSYSDDPDYRNNPSSLIGEYDNEWDLMSASHVHLITNAKYGTAPPSLNGYYMDLFGWLPMDRVYTFGQKGETSGTLTLTTLFKPALNGLQLIRVPFDSSDPRHYYLIEMRFKENWDAGFDQNRVFIHEIKLNPAKDNTVKKIYYAYLLRMHNTPAENPVTSLDKNNVKITIGAINVQARTVSVTIASNFAGSRLVNGPLGCQTGYDWARTNKYDYKCVVSTTKKQRILTNPTAILKAIKRLQANNYLLLLKKLYAAESEQYDENLLR